MMLAWIDLETTGTDEAADPILEVGMIVTDDNLAELDACSVIVRPTATWVTRLQDNDVVRNMHAMNGLAVDVLLNPGAVLPHQAEEMLIQHLDHLGNPHDFMLAGSGVAHFDRRFLKAQMPSLEAWFRYPVLDVGVIRRALKFAGRDDLIPPQPDKNHRALDDIRLHLEEYRLYHTMFTQIGVADDAGDGHDAGDGADAGDVRGVGAPGVDGPPADGGTSHRGPNRRGKLPANRRS